MTLKPYIPTPNNPSLSFYMMINDAGCVPGGVLSPSPPARLLNRRLSVSQFDVNEYFVRTRKYAIEYENDSNKNLTFNHFLE